MKGQFAPKILFVTGIAMLVTLPIMPSSSVASAANGADGANVITHELKKSPSNQAKEEKKSTSWNWFKKEEESDNNVPVQRQKTKKEQQEFAGPLQDFHREINRLFDQTFRNFGFSSFDINRPFLPSVGNMLRPMTDLSANDKEYTVTVEVPGAEKDDIKIEVANNIMTIRGEKKQKKEEKEKDYYRQERFYGSFQRVFSLPKDADQTDIKATFKQGVLTVTMPRKKMPKSDVKEIEIHSS
ncbi:MAG: Hsp20/alpha crystallin family protein [Candidatus Electrothrix gigas]